MYIGHEFQVFSFTCFLQACVCVRVYLLDVIVYSCVFISLLDQSEWRAKTVVCCRMVRIMFA